MPEVAHTGSQQLKATLSRLFEPVHVALVAGNQPWWQSRMVVMTQNHLLRPPLFLPIEKVKSGACPFRPHGLCLEYEPHECLNDWECPKDQKCCPSICSNKCLDPVDPSEQGEETESWKRGPERFQLEDTHLGEVAGSRGGGGGQPARPTTHPSANESLCLSDTCSTGWGPLGGKGAPSGHSRASVWVLR